jgi:hypothetical protein
MFKNGDQLTVKYLLRRMEHYKLHVLGKKPKGNMGTFQETGKPRSVKERLNSANKATRLLNGGIGSYRQAKFTDDFHPTVISMFSFISKEIDRHGCDGNYSKEAERYKSMLASLKFCMLIASNHTYD